MTNASKTNHLQPNAPGSLPGAKACEQSPAPRLRLLARDMRMLASEMSAIAFTMQTLDLGNHAVEMNDAADIAREWACEIEALAEKGI